MTEKLFHGTLRINQPTNKLCQCYFATISKHIQMKVCYGSENNSMLFSENVMFTKFRVNTNSIEAIENFKVHIPKKGMVYVGHYRTLAIVSNGILIDLHSV